MNRAYGAFCIFCFLPVFANAAEITVLDSYKPTPEIGKVIKVFGEITAGDDLRLISALHEAPANTLVLLTSPGGLIAPALAMGRSIRKAGANTLVSDVCASACGLVWLAGTKRFTYSDGQIGFHAAYSGVNSAVTGMGNALIGAYVAELGFGENVIRYVTEKPPEGMQWLNEREADLLGIDVIALPKETLLANSETQNSNSTVIPALPEQSREKNTTQGEASNENKATAFVIEIVNQHLADTATAISFVYNNYGDKVAYFGKRLSVTEVVADKQAYMERWPIRQTRVRTPTLVSKCDLETCFVTGVYDWAVSNPILKKKLSGSATFAYGFAVTGAMVVIYEDGKVLERN